MTFDADALYALMPAIYRIRDQEMARYPGPCGELEGPLKALLRVIAGQVALVEDNLAQLYDDQFIETCAEWVVPYIGDLIGVRHLHSMDAALGAQGLPSIGEATLSERADVANTIGYRRRKGTLSMLEPMARDVTGWPARAVEYFRLLAATQFMGHRRLDNHTVDVRRTRQLERLDTPFETLVHTVDARSIERHEGRYNLPDIGIFLWRLRAYPLTGSPAQPVGSSGRLYRFHPLGIDTPLFARARTEDEFVDLSIPSQPYNLPAPITRSLLSEQLGELYGAVNSLVVTVDGQDIPAAQIAVADLSTQGNGQWRRGPAGAVAIDPELGRITFSTGVRPQNVTVTFYYGFSADMGGGQYDRSASLQVDTPPGPEGAPLPVIEVRGGTGIQAALTQLQAGGIVRIMDSGRYDERVQINAGAGVTVELQAADGCRPTLALGGDLRIRGAEGAVIILNGLLVEGGRVALAGSDCSLRVDHCTLVPGLSLQEDGLPSQPREPSLVVEAAGATVEVRYSICGGIRAADTVEVELTASIVDATGETLPAYAAPDGIGAGGPLSVDRCTVIGTVHAEALGLASNSIFAARGGHHGEAVRVERQQVGCARFSSIPPGSRTPPRYACQPGRGSDPRTRAPRFTSLRYGEPGYCQLSSRCPAAISQGAADESEMGAFHDLFQPQRVTNLRVRLDEYLRFGLKAGIFFST